MSAVYEKEKLAYRLLEGESAKRLERPGASLRYSVLPCAGEKVGTVIFYTAWQAMDRAGRNS